MTFAVFGQMAGFEFVNFDDDQYVSANATVAGGLSLKGVAWVFTHADCYLYHPLTMLSFMADYQLHGLHAGVKRVKPCFCPICGDVQRGGGCKYQLSLFKLSDGGVQGNWELEVQSAKFGDFDRAGTG
jgi:hypothetical protein